MKSIQPSQRIWMNCPACLLCAVHLVNECHVGPKQFLNPIPQGSQVPIWVQRSSRSITSGMSYVYGLGQFPFMDTQDPQPYTLNPKPSTQYPINPKPPSTLNPIPATDEVFSGCHSGCCAMCRTTAKRAPKDSRTDRTKGIHGSI